MESDFNYCPKCSSEKISFDGQKRYECSNCSFIYYKSVGSAAAVIIEYQGKIIFIRRNNEPKKGMLCLPGGCADLDEGAEQVAKREVKEEIGIEISDLNYIGSFPNIYINNNIEYRICDIYYTARPVSYDFKKQDSEVQEIVFLKPKEIKLKEIAFSSSKKALEKYLNMINK